jgi:hypothetical protein
MGVQRSTTEIRELELEVQEYGVRSEENQENGNTTEFNAVRELGQLEIATGS